MAMIQVECSQVEKKREEARRRRLADAGPKHAFVMSCRTRSASAPADVNWTRQVKNTVQGGLKQYFHHVVGGAPCGALHSCNSDLLIYLRCACIPGNVPAFAAIREAQKYVEVAISHSGRIDA